MKNRLLALLLFCFIIPAFGQNQKDKNGKRSGKWVFKGADRPNSGVPKDRKVEEGYFVNGRKEGVWIKYYKDGKTVKLRGNYTNNRPEGDYKRYFKDGKLNETGSFGDDQYKGELTRYYPNGKVAYSGKYNNSGKETGTIKYFHENGNLALEYNVKNNFLEGEINRYYEDGSLKETFTVSQNGEIQNIKKNDQKPKQETKEPEAIVLIPPKIKNPNTKGLRFTPNGYNKIYNENDEIWMDGDFKNGQLWNGKVFDYDKDGILQKVRIFKNGIYHSDGQL